LLLLLQLLLLLPLKANVRQNAQGGNTHK